MRYSDNGIRIEDNTIIYIDTDQFEKPDGIFLEPNTEIVIEGNHINSKETKEGEI